MTRYVVTMDDGIRWELSAGSVVEAAERADDSARRWGLQPARAQIVQTLEQYVESERARFVAEMAEIGRWWSGTSDEVWRWCGADGGHRAGSSPG